jgi:pimeloyl-ACP methyl ester carboxylesterase
MLSDSPNVSRIHSIGNGVKPSEIVSMGGRFVVDIYGDSSKHPVVFICGWGMTSDFYHEGLLGLSENFYVYSVSLPGFGKALPLSMKQSNIAGHANLIREAIEGLALDRKVTLMGHSAGGGISVFIAEANPSLVSEVVLVTPIGSRDPLVASFKRMITKSNPRDIEVVARDKGLLKNWLYNLKLGIDAKNLNLNNDIERLASKGIPVSMLLSRSDVVAPAGSLADVKGASLHWVNGGHAWIKDNPQEFVNLSNVILSRHIVKSTPVKETRFRRWFNKVKFFLGRSKP